ncbi:MAG TPA: hypothetical protein VGV91_01680 [Rubrobacter sp.]|nr:hypothetical protein [Rubrobacter sp.]
MGGQDGGDGVRAGIGALLFGVASTALGANGGGFILGKATNAATRVTGLVGRVAAGEALVVKNPSGGSALGLSVGDPAADPATKAVAPMKVDSQAKVANLNADTVDGQDAPLWAVINAAGLAENWHGMTGNRRVNEGRYQIFFNRDVSRCAYSATPWAQASDVYVQGSATSTVPITSNSVIVQVYTMDGSLQVNRGFSLVVHC